MNYLTQPSSGKALEVQFPFPTIETSYRNNPIACDLLATHERLPWAIRRRPNTGPDRKGSNPMVTRSEAFPSKYWKASDLPPRGKKFKIAKLQLERVGPDQQEKYALFFKGEDKQLILNVTNWDAIAEFGGANSDSWTNKNIVLYPDKTTFGGKTVDCIRIRQPQPQPPQAAPIVKKPKPEPPVDDPDDPGFQPEDAVESY